MTKDEVLKLALDALEHEADAGNDDAYKLERDAIKEALAQPEQEPVACDGDFPEGFDASLGVPAQALRAANAILFDVIGKREWDVPCTAQHVLSFAQKYTTPPQRKPLTQKQVDLILAKHELNYVRGKDRDDLLGAIRDIEAAHGIKENT